MRSWRLFWARITGCLRVRNARLNGPGPDSVGCGGRGHCELRGARPRRGRRSGCPRRQRRYGPGDGEGLDQPGTAAVLALEIGGQTTQHHARNTAGQMDAAHRRADQEAAHAHDPVARRVALPGTPRDPAVACPGMECARGKPDGAEPARLPLHEVAHPAAGNGGQAVRMLIGHQGVPDATRCSEMPLRRS